MPGTVSQSSPMVVECLLTPPVHFSILEPGGVKTNYATTSIKYTESRHPAYIDPSFPASVMLGYLASNVGRENWAEPADLAATMFALASAGKRLPIRLPLGPDAWGLVSADIEGVRKDLDEFKDISLSIGDAKQLESASFLL